MLTLQLVVELLNRINMINELITLPNMFLPASDCSLYTKLCITCVLLVREGGMLLRLAYLELSEHRPLHHVVELILHARCHFEKIVRATTPLVQIESTHGALILPFSPLNKITMNSNPHAFEQTD